MMQQCTTIVQQCDTHTHSMCQVMQSLGGGSGSSLMNTLSQAAQVVSSVHSAATTAQSLGTLASLLQSLGTASTATGTGSGSGANTPTSSALNSLLGLGADDQSSKSSFVSNLINGLSALSGPVMAGAATGLPLPGNTPATGTSNFSPLIAVLDFLASSEKSPVSSLLPARRKKPFDLDDLASEAAAVMAQANKVPPTPCPSLEEYIG